MKMRELAKCIDFEVGLHNGCILTMLGHFDYDGGSQGLGYAIDAAFLIRFLAVFGVESLRAVNGRSCWVTHDQGKIYLIEPLHKRDRRPFDLAAWAEWTTKNSNFSPHELLTGEAPPPRPNGGTK